MCGVWQQFIDLCILLGCDYLEPIKGVGPKTALKLVREHGGLKEVLEHLKEKYVFFRLFSFCLSRPFWLIISISPYVK